MSNGAPYTERPACMHPDRSETGVLIVIKAEKVGCSYNVSPDDKWNDLHPQWMALYLGLFSIASSVFPRLVTVVNQPDALIDRIECGVSYHRTPNECCKKPDCFSMYYRVLNRVGEVVSIPEREYTRMTTTIENMTTRFTVLPCVMNQSKSLVDIGSMRSRAHVEEDVHKRAATNALMVVEDEDALDAILFPKE